MQKVTMSVRYEMWNRTKVHCEENMREMDAENQALKVQHLIVMSNHILASNNMNKSILCTPFKKQN